MRFAQREYLVLLAIVLPVATALFVAAWKARLQALARFGNPVLMHRMIETTSRDRQRFKLVLMVLVLALLLLALARPQWGKVDLPIKRTGIDIMIAVDVSLSMLAEDVGTGGAGGGRSRLDKAIEEVNGLIDFARGDRIGLVAFAGKAEVICPLTLHYGALKMFLNDLSPYTISEPGTAIAHAIRTAAEAFEMTERKYKALVLITDGEETVQTKDDVLAAAEKARELGVRVYCISIGSGESFIPVAGEDGNVQFKRDRHNELVKTQPDPDTLRKVALITNGKYYAATTEGMELERIYAALAELEQKQLQENFRVQYVDRYYYFVAAALFCLMLEFMLSERKRTAVWHGRAI